MNQVLEDFTKFLGSINFDCSGNRLDYLMEGNKMVFKDSSIQRVYEAYRQVLASGYRMGQKAMYDALQDPLALFLRDSMALAPK